MTALLTVFVPAGMEGTTFEENSIVNGNKTKTRYQTRPWNGWWIVDILLGFFNRLIDGPKGKDWDDSNPEVVEWRRQGDRRLMACNAFPGEHRAPRVVQTSVMAAPFNVTLKAPEGVSSFSHGGVEHKIGKDGTITVLDHVADVLRSHGFKDAA